MLRSDLCDFNDACIVVKGDITLEGDNDANKQNKNVTFENNAPFINCFLKIYGIKIDNAEDLDFVMPMYNLLDTVSSNSESFKYKTSIVGKTSENNDSLTDQKVVISLKHLSNFWMALSILLINCEVEFVLICSKNCALLDMTVDADADPVIVAPSGATFKITDTKLFVPVVTLSKKKKKK